MAWNQAGNSLTSDIPSLLCVGVRGVFVAAEEADDWLSGNVYEDARRRRSGPGSAPAPVTALVHHAGLNGVPASRRRDVVVDDRLGTPAGLHVGLVDVEPDQASSLLLFALEPRHVLVV